MLKTIACNHFKYSPLKILGIIDLLFKKYVDNMECRFYTKSALLWMYQNIPKNIPNIFFHSVSVQLLSRVQLFATPWTKACQASLSITNTQGLHKLMSIELVMLSSHLILCRPLPLLPPISLSIRVFSNESALRIRLPKYWSFSFSISPSKEH